MLILQAKRDVLLKPLLAVTGLVERRHTLPVLANVLCEKRGEALSFLATDLEVQITTSHLGTAVGQDFRLTISAKKIQEILRALPADALVSLESKDSTLTLKTGKSRFHLQTLPVESFPTLVFDQAVQMALTLSQHELKRAITHVQYAIGINNPRHYMNGLLLQTLDNTLNLTATDGHRLAFSTTHTKATLPTTEAIIPRKTILEMYKLLADGDDESTILEVAATQLRLSLGETVLISKLVDAQAPDYQRVIPLDNDKIFLVNREALLAALQRAAILANEKFRDVCLALKPGCLSIVCSNKEPHEEAQEELDIAYEGSELEMSFNINYLIDMLTHAPSESLQVAWGEVGHSVLFTVPQSNDFKYVLMPMRV